MPFRRHRLQPGDADTPRQLLSYTVVLLGLSLPFYLVGPVIGSLSGFTRANVPASALMAVCPACAAVLVARRSGELSGLVEMVARRPRLDWSWLVAVAGMPIVIVVAALLDGQGGGFTAQGWSALALAVAYVAAAVGEEIGWTAFVLPRLEPAIGELAAGLAIGAGWGLWHVVPYVQAGHSAGWVLGQCVFSVVFRLLLVRLALATGVDVAGGRSARRLQPRLVAVPRCGRGIRPLGSCRAHRRAGDHYPYPHPDRPGRAHMTPRVSDPRPDPVARIEAGHRTSAATRQPGAAIVRRPAHRSRRGAGVVTGRAGSVRGWPVWSAATTIATSPSERAWSMSAASSGSSENRSRVATMR